MSLFRIQNIYTISSNINESMMFEKRDYQTLIYEGSESQNGVDSSALLPKDLTDTANERLSLLALALSAVGVFSYIYYYIVTYLIQTQTASFRLNVPILIIIFLSLFVSFITRRHLFNSKTLHSIGIAYVILTALLIIISNTATEWWVSRDRLQGVSWVCVWIVLFPIVVPCTTLKATLIAMGMAIMGPVGLFISTTFLGRAAATFTAYLDLFIPNLISAVMAIFISHVIFNLSKDIQAAKKMGSYILQHKLGEGGMGEVWQATHHMLSRPAAIKLILPEIIDLGESEVAEAQDRFLEEAKITSTLTSPHTVELYDFGVTDDRSFYYVMELLSGDDLNWIIKRSGPMPANRVVYLMIQMCESLAEAHNIGLIHRDIKPANIFVCHIGLQYDFIKILDFGLAKNLSENIKPMKVEGTPGFMAPESLDKNAKINNSVDIYALGCVAYWMLTTKNVFGINLELPIASNNSNLNLSNPIPADLDQLIRKCLAKEPTDRPESAEVLAEQLSKCDIGEAWNNEIAKEWWLRQTGEARNNANPDVDPDAVTEVGSEPINV
jgi:eukaryotic-like serine/threonine-protein kinase